MCTDRVKMAHSYWPGGSRLGLWPWPYNACSCHLSTVYTSCRVSLLKARGHIHKFANLFIFFMKKVVLVTQLYLTLCDPLSLPGSSVHGILQARILEWVAVLFLQGIFPTQSLNLGLLHCRQILYHLSHQGNPYSSLYLDYQQSI